METLRDLTGSATQGFTVKDSGKREDFPSGAVRDTQDGKPRPDLISPFFLIRLGQHLSLGALKYSAWNWEKGISMARCLASAQRHLLQFAMGMRDEDHLSAVAFNVMCIIHFEETGRGELDDLVRFTIGPTQVNNGNEKCFAGTSGCDCLDKKEKLIF